MSYVFGVDREIADRGFDYYLWGRVVSCLPTFDEAVFEAEVLGSNDNIYNVEVDVDNLFDSTCDCKYFDREDSPCKHILAAFFEVMDGLTEEDEHNEAEDDGFIIIDEDEDDEDDEEEIEGVYDINRYRVLENIDDDEYLDGEHPLEYAEYAEYAESANEADHAEYAYEAHEAEYAKTARVAEYAKYARHIIDDSDEDNIDEHEDDPEYERTKKLVKDSLGQLSFNYKKYRADGDIPFDSRYEEEPGKCVNIEDFIRSNDYALDDEYDLEYPIDDFDESGRFVGKNRNKKYGIKDFVDSLDDEAVRECLTDVLEKLESLGFDIDVRDY